MVTLNYPLTETLLTSTPYGSQNRGRRDPKNGVTGYSACLEAKSVSNEGNGRSGSNAEIQPFKRYQR